MTGHPAAVRLAAGGAINSARHDRVSAAPIVPAASTPATGRTATILIALLGPLLLFAHTYAATASADFTELGSWRRLWSDLAVATAAWIDHAHGPAPDRVVARGEAADMEVRRALLRRIEREERAPTRPFATIVDRPFVLDRLAPEPKAYDDKGRAVLLTWAFRLRGGIAPFLVLWLGALLAAPVMAWTAVELANAGRRAAALAFVLLLCLSPYVVETLALARYPVGFYLAALLLLIPLAVYGQLHPRPTPRGLVVRVIGAAAVLTLCVFCRSSAALLGPGFLLATALGVRRVMGMGRAAAAALLVAAVLFALPSRLVQDAQQNDMWQPVWEGLGDFDREKGYTWSDAAAEDAARRGGAASLWTDESEAVFRAQIQRDVVGDPSWFAGILTRRLASTVTLWKLWPWGPWDGTFIRRHTTANEGVIDKYWTYTTTVDHVGFAARAVELPVPLLLAPAVALGLMAFDGRSRASARGALAVLSCVAAAALVLPVLITTAGGQEPEAFAVTYLLAAAFIVDLGWRRLRTRIHA
jgi:hypothetical protein